MTLYSDRELIRDVTEALDADGVRYEVLPPGACERIVGWLRGLPSTNLGWLDWGRMSDTDCACWDHTDDLQRTFEVLCDRHSLGDPEVTVVWGNALRPCVRLRLSAVRRHFQQIAEADSDVWIARPSKGWLIEAFHEGTVCFGRAPTETIGGLDSDG